LETNKMNAWVNEAIECLRNGNEGGILQLHRHGFPLNKFLRHPDEPER
jgi:hypothetical protein